MRRLLLCSLLALPLACAESPTEATPERDSPDISLSVEPLAQPWAESITGSGHFVASSYLAPFPVWRTMVIHAQKAPDGTVGGRFQITLHLKDGVNIARGEVVCFTVVGNTAWIGAHKEGNSPPDIAFQVVDHGEGSGAPPDEVGLYLEASKWGLPSGMAQAFCDEAPESISVPGVGSVDLASVRHPVEAGNIQVRVK